MHRCACLCLQSQESALSIMVQIVKVNKARELIKTDLCHRSKSCICMAVSGISFVCLRVRHCALPMHSVFLNRYTVPPEYCEVK